MPLQLAPQAGLERDVAGLPGDRRDAAAAPELEHAAFRALQFTQLTTTGLLED